MAIGRRMISVGSPRIFHATPALGILESRMEPEE